MARRASGARRLRAGIPNLGGQCLLTRFQIVELVLDSLELILHRFGGGRLLGSARSHALRLVESAGLPPERLAREVLVVLLEGQDRLALPIAGLLLELLFLLSESLGASERLNQLAPGAGQRRFHVGHCLPDQLVRILGLIDQRVEVAFDHPVEATEDTHGPPLRLKITRGKLPVKGLSFLD